MGRAFGWLWAAYTTSTIGTWLAFDAFPIIAVGVLHAGPAAVSLLAAAGPAAGALLAVPLGPWLDARRKRPVMITMDLVRAAALLTVPAAYALGLLGFGQLLAVAVLVAAADIAFTAASGACLKALLPRTELLRANGRFESTMWTAAVLGPPLGGGLIGLFGPVTTVLANAASFVFSAAGIRAIGPEPAPETTSSGSRGVAEGWRFLLTHRRLRALFFNTIAVNSLIMATAPLLAVLMLGKLGFPPWEYGLAFAAPCLGGLLGSRLSRRAVARLGQRRTLLMSGTLRACWLPGLAFIGQGVPGLLLVIGVELGLITCSAMFTPVLATYRLEELPADRVARVLTAWSITVKAAIAGMTALWGVLAAVTGPRTAIAVAGVLSLATPLLLRRPTRNSPAAVRSLARRL